MGRAADDSGVVSQGGDPVSGFKADEGLQATARTGRAAEDRALAYLLGRGLRLVMRNYRVARGPSARAGEVDLIVRDTDGTLVFVEVRARRSRTQGGAAASVGAAKRARVLFAAQHYLQRWRGALPPCRFDVVAIDGEELVWLPAAFDAG